MPIREGDRKAINAIVKGMEEIKARHEDSVISGEDAVKFAELHVELGTLSEQATAMAKADEISAEFKALADTAIVQLEVALEAVAGGGFKSFGELAIGDLKDFKAGDWSLGMPMREITYHGEAKTLVGPTTSLGSALVPVQRDGGITLPMQPLLVRSLFASQPTSAASIEYWRQTVRTNNADFVSEELTSTNVKPESAVTYELVTDGVKTIAHWIPATTNMLDDASELQGMLDIDLTYGLNYKEDQALLWGDGLGNNIQGVIGATGTQNHTRVAADTLSDTIRRMITKSFNGAFARPDFALMSPEALEGLELQKDDNGSYMYVLINGQVWGLRIVDTPAAEDPDTAGNHYLVVGNGTLGARIHDRATANVQVGVVDKQFVQNARTILAEKRLAFSIRRPQSFVYSSITEDGNGIVS